ncbi:MAG: ATP F0F1 synthase subunit B [Pseudomonadota bacterium]
MTARLTALISLSAIAVPAALAADSYSDKPRDEAVGFGYLTYGFTDVTTMVALAALIVFLIFVWYVGGFKLIFGALDNRTETIRKQLEEAKTLREEAAKALAEAERKAKEADELADDIVKRAKADAEAMMKQAQVDLEAKVERREAQAESRIARAEADAEAEVRRAAADAATQAARTIIAKADDSDELFDKALSEIESRLN